MTTKPICFVKYDPTIAGLLRRYSLFRVEAVSILLNPLLVERIQGAIHAYTEVGPTI